MNSIFYKGATMEDLENMEKIICFVSKYNEIDYENNFFSTKVINTVTLTLYVLKSNIHKIYALNTIDCCTTASIDEKENISETKNVLKEFYSANISIKDILILGLHEKYNRLNEHAEKEAFMNTFINIYCSPMKMVAD